MSILNAARQHFGAKPVIYVLGPQEFRKKLAELQREISHLQQSYERLRLADIRAGNRGDARDYEEIHVVSSPVEKELATLHGWTVSLVETLFTLVAMENGLEEEKALRREWQIHV